MIGVLLYGKDAPVLKLLTALLDAKVRALAHERPFVARCQSDCELDQALASRGEWSMACVDIGAGEGMTQVFRIRDVCQDVGLLLMVDEGVSPVVYIRPGVMPSALIQRPFREAEFRAAVDDFAEFVVRGVLASGDEDFFTIEGKDGVERLPYASIVAFEAKAKRVYARMSREEHGFYDTLDALQRRLPDVFARCHRSYIINVDHVRRLDLSHGEVCMEDGTRIPVSRSYRTKIREVLS